MDINIYSPDEQANNAQANQIITDHFKARRFLDVMHRVSMVSPTLENLDAQTNFEAVLADELPTHIHLIGAIASVQEYRETRDRPNLIAVYCTTVNPLTGTNDECDRKNCGV